MIDTITSKIKKYPFQTGIIAGCILCLLFSLFIGIFQDHGKTLSGNNELIQEDYLRMAINEFTENNDAKLAAWRYKFLGSKADEVLARMCADSSISAKELLRFADAVQKRGVVDTLLGNSHSEGSPTNPKRGISVFGKILLLLVGIGIIVAGGLYIYSKYGKNTKKADWTGKINELFTHRKPVQVVYPDDSWQEETFQEEPFEEPFDGVDDTPFDLDKLFTESGNGFMHKKEVYEPIQETPAQPSRSARSSMSRDKNAEGDNAPDYKPIIPSEEDEAEERSKKSCTVTPRGFSGSATGSSVPAAAPQRTANASSPSPAFNADTDGNSFPDDHDEPFSEEGNPVRAEESYDEQPLSTPDTNKEDADAETESAGKQEENDALSRGNMLDALIEEKRGYEIKGEEALQRATHTAEELHSQYTSQQKNSSSDAEKHAQSHSEPEAVPFAPDSSHTAADKKNNELLLHFQSRYSIGNDNYDEVFSIEQLNQDTTEFRGECGIGIGETLNNTEPKAVTAFEVWLFDRDDIHTATEYLLSNFAAGNEGISSRLKVHGLCDTIHQGSVYTLETKSLVMDFKVLELEYGNETEEQKAYFRDVLFDVCVREKA